MNEAKVMAPIGAVLNMASRAAGNFVTRTLEAGDLSRPDGLTLIGVGAILAAATYAGVMATAIQRSEGK